MTINVIRTQWSTDINVGGINSSFIQDCVNYCEVYQEIKIWDKILTVLLDNLSATIDALYTKHSVPRRGHKCHM